MAMVAATIKSAKPRMNGDRVMSEFSSRGVCASQAGRILQAQDDRIMTGEEKPIW